MNFSAFVDEYIKIAADFTLSGEALQRTPHREILSGTARSGGDLGSQLRASDKFLAGARAQEALRTEQLNKLLQSGEFNPKTHSMRTFMQTGQVVEKPPPTAPPVRSTEAATKVLPKPSEAATAVKKPPTAPKRVPRIPRKVPAQAGRLSRLVGRVGKMGVKGKAGLLTTALGLAGAGGYGLGEMVD